MFVPCNYRKPTSEWRNYYKRELEVKWYSCNRSTTFCQCWKTMQFFMHTFHTFPQNTNFWKCHNLWEIIIMGLFSWMIFPIRSCSQYKEWVQEVEPRYQNLNSNYVSGNFAWYPCYFVVWTFGCWHLDLHIL